MVINEEPRNESFTEARMEEDPLFSTMDSEKEDAASTPRPDNIEIIKDKRYVGSLVPSSVQLDEQLRKKVKALHIVPPRVQLDEPAHKKVKILHMNQPQNSTLKHLKPGMHIWYGRNPQNTDQMSYAYHHFSGADQYEILQAHESENMFSVKRLKTGITYKTRLPGKIRFKLET